MTPYRLDNNGDVPLLGRRTVLGEVVGWLTQDHPDHVSLVGPRHIGKTVLLRHLIRDLGWSRGVYKTVAYLDLRLHAPQNDKAFVQLLASTLQSALKPHSELYTDIDPNSPDLFDIFPPVLSLLREGGIRVLVVLDGCDAVLAKPGITQNLWHNLREWGQSGALRFLTASRARLSELCCDPQSQASDFWRNFHDPPRQIGPFEDSDWRGVLSPLEDLGGMLDDSGRKEIANWTGGHPALVSLLCGRLAVAAAEKKKIDKMRVDAAAEAVLKTKSDWLPWLWKDCPSPVQAQLAAVATRLVKRQEIGEEHFEFGIARGYWCEEDGTVKSTCRLMERYAKTNGSDAREVNQFFRTPEKYAENIRAVLGARLAQVKNADRELRRNAERWLEDIPGDPAIAILPARIIANRALALVLKAELPSGQVPPEWCRQWSTTGAGIANAISSGPLPNGLGVRARVLREAVGTLNTPRLTKYATKETAALIDFVKTIGDYAQHPDEDSSVQLGIAVSGVFAVIELIEHIARELAPLK